MKTRKKGMSVAESEARPRVNSRHAQCGYAYRRRAGEATPTAAPRYHDNSTHHTATIISPRPTRAPLQQLYEE